MSTDLTSRVAELAASIEARLAEDEAPAAAATPGPWHVTSTMVFAVNGRSVVPPAGMHAPQDEDLAHIARNDPARALRRVKATRDLVAEIMAERHDYNEGDSWYSCSQAEDPDPAPGEGGPGSGCSNDDRAGQPCDHGPDSPGGPPPRHHRKRMGRRCVNGRRLGSCDQR